MKTLYESILDKVDISDESLIIDNLMASRSEQEYMDWSERLIKYISDNGFKMVKTVKSGCAVSELTSNFTGHLFLKFYDFSKKLGYTLRWNSDKRGPLQGN